jgi:hypothetical protein
MSLGYARARRDQACIYSLGFYVDDFAEDRIGDVTVCVCRKGMRAVHPSKYVIRSKERKRISMLKAAWISPEMFQSGLVRAHVFPMRPASDDAWSVVLAVSFPVPLAETGGANARREFGALLQQGAKNIHSFARSIALQPDSPDVTTAPEVTFLQSLELAPGPYTLTTVLSDPAGTVPHATRIEIEVPEILEREPFLVGPVLGRRSGSNIVVTGGGAEPDADKISDPAGFQPLLVQQVDGPVDLVALTQACVVGSKRYFKKKGDQPTGVVDRKMRASSGESIGQIEPVEMTLEGEGQVRCATLVDVLPASRLPSGEYEFEAALSAQEGDGPRETVRFSVGVIEH